MSSWLTDLRNILSEEQVVINETVRELHSRDESYHSSCLPDVVLFPRTTEDVSHIMKIANQYEISVVPFGVGSSLEGHVIPYENGITIDFSLMNKVLEVREKDFLVKVQPGVTRLQLNKELKKYGLFFSVDPGADATLGGMAATNASGTTSVKYGVMRDQVRDLEIVLSDGRIIHTGNLSAKSSSGYHLNGLFVGSEGTLGCFTELTLKVYGIPEHVAAGRASFPSVNDAVEAVIHILQAGIPIARIELVDQLSMKQVNLYSETNYREEPTLFLEFHGNEAGLQEDIAFTKDIVQNYGCNNIEFETSTAARNKLWEARHHLAYAYVHKHPGKKLMSMDVCLPISHLAGAIDYAREVIESARVEAGIVGHVGDGNFHVLLMVNPLNQEEIGTMETINEKIVLYALERGGTCTGEHGVGIGKRKYQEREHGSALLVMKQLKQMLDPKNILNPGKIFEEEKAHENVTSN
ncbi:FAD-binding oxidoreductase [Bacillus manliponensis]|uniref:FAD-binding oxidoreductase n=1 Tax=Bacillus manliponensis TaxID=574376 RepID=UPI003519665A